MHQSIAQYVGVYRVILHVAVSQVNFICCFMSFSLIYCSRMATCFFFFSRKKEKHSIIKKN